MRQILIVIATAVALAGCANSPSAPVASLTGPTGIASSNSVAGQAVSVNPTSVTQNCTSFPFSVTASTNFAGTITAEASGFGCSVSPASQEAVGSPAGGGTKSAVFTVNPGFGCTVIFTDKKGNTATTNVSVNSDSSSCL